MIIKCVICGEQFEAEKYRKTCGKECKRELVLQTLQTKKNAKPKVSTLDQKIKQANEEGISYGKLQARQTIAEQWRK